MQSNSFKLSLQFTAIFFFPMQYLLLDDAVYHSHLSFNIPVLFKQTVKSDKSLHCSALIHSSLYHLHPRLLLIQSNSFKLSLQFTAKVLFPMQYLLLDDAVYHSHLSLNFPVVSSHKGKLN